MARTLFVSDLDGTLLNDQAECSDRTVRILNGLIAHGLLFTYATARSFSSAGSITNRLHLALPVITYNGTFIVDPSNGSLMEGCFLSKEKIHELLEVIASCSLAPLVYAYVGGRERVSWHRDYVHDGIQAYLQSRKGDARLREVGSYEDLFAGEIFYITFIEYYEQMRLIAQLLPKSEYLAQNFMQDIYNPAEYWMEISRFDATKDVAVKKVQKMVGAQRLVCFGDNLNDISMFRQSDESYAVENAVKVVKESATGIIGPNRKESVAERIRALFHSGK